MAWYDISDMPWLARDPIERVTEAGVRGAQVGSMMAQTRQRDRQLNLQEKELQQRQAADALRAKVQQQQLTLNSLNIDSAIRERDDLVGNQAALSVLSSYVGGALKSANPDYQLMRAGALDIMAINPKLFRDKRAMDFLDQIKIAEDLTNDAARIRATKEANDTDRLLALKRANDGSIIPKSTKVTMPDGREVGVIYNQATGSFQIPTDHSQDLTAKPIEGLPTHVRVGNRIIKVDDLTASGKLTPIEQRRATYLFGKLTRLEKQLADPAVSDDEEERNKVTQEHVSTQRKIQELEMKATGSAKPSAAKPAPSTTRVKVRHPDGRTGNIPADQLQKAREQGYEEVK